MSGPKPNTLSSQPRWNGSRVLFEIRDGGRQVACSISVQALQDLTSRRHVRSAELLRCFEAARARIEAIANAKLRVRSPNFSGLVYIWSEDIDEAPPQPSAPVTAMRRAKTPRTA